MRMRRSLVLPGLLATGISLATALPAAAQGSTQVGTLTCNVAPGPGFIITSSKGLDCLFHDSRGRREVYTGTINKFGLDIGATGPGRLVWSVIAPTNRIGRGALAGAYGGATGEATVGAGVGANILVGGSNQTISLQPISVQGQTGLNLAVGVASLTLDPGPRVVRIEERRRPVQ
jgi:hypothetical protein